MIKYNSNTINDWYYDTSDIIKVYRNGAVVYYKVISSGTTPTYQVCYAVVDDISQYQETEFEDVYNKADSKWYKLNNLNQYEQYGIYGDSIASSGSSRLPQGYTEVEYIENTTSAYLNLNVIPYASASNSYSIEAKVSSQYYSTGNWEYLFSCEQGNQSPYNGSYLRWNKYNVSTVYLDLTGTNITSTGITDNGDGTSAITMSCNSTNATNTTPITLFCGLQGSTVWRNGKGKFYSFKVTLNNTLVRDMIPCKRDNDNMVGMYDLVNDVFYYPPNYTSYQLVASSAVTPTAATTYEGKLAIVDGYEYMYSGSSWNNVGEVSGSSITIKSPEYIEKNLTYGSGSVDIGYSLKDNTRFQIKVMPTYSGGGLVLGQTNATSDNDDYRIFWSASKLYYDYGSTRMSTSQAINTTYEYEVGNYYVKNLITSATVLTGTTKSGIATSMNRTIGVWATSSTRDRARVYYLKVYEGDTLVRDMIPWTDMNGNYGLFDKVSMNTFQSTNQITASTTINDVEVGGGYAYPLYYDEKADPLNNLSFDTMEEAQDYAYNNCVYDGLKATIDGDKYYFDSTDENGWVESLEPTYYTLQELIDTHTVGGDYYERTLSPTVSGITHFRIYVPNASTEGSYCFTDLNADNATGTTKFALKGNSTGDLYSSVGGYGSIRAAADDSNCKWAYWVDADTMEVDVVAAVNTTIFIKKYQVNFPPTFFSVSFE